LTKLLGEQMMPSWTRLRGYEAGPFLVASPGAGVHRPFDFGVLSKLPLQRRSESFTIGRSAFPIFLAIQARIVAKDYPSGEQV
jgi:hypothetical protein